MPVIQDTLWKNPGNPGMIVIPGHAALEDDGSLFMGYGEAAEAARRIPNLPQECGQIIRENMLDGIYGFLPVRPSRPEERIVGLGLFQTHFHWNERIDRELIRYSMDCLRQFTHEYPELKIRMSFPGIGADGPDMEEIGQILIPIPANVTLCHQGELRRSVPDTFPGFKAIYLQVEGLLKDGLQNQAVEYLVSVGFDLQSALEQVSAVQRMLKERSGKKNHPTQIPFFSNKNA